MPPSSTQKETRSYFLVRSPFEFLREFLTVPTARSFDFRTVFWLVLSLAVAAYFASEGLRQAFHTQYVVQDDARQHVFWMERFLDGGLFPRDLIADYFQAMAPYGYSGLYGLMSLLGIDPLLLNKLLPLALGLATTAYCFGLTLQLLRVPAAAFISSLLLNHSLWMQDDLISATPRAFFYPLVLAFLYYLSRRSWLPCLAALALQGLFYPSSVFISVGILILRSFEWRGGRPHLSQDKRDYLVCAVGLAVSTIVLLIYALKSSGFGPVVMASEARSMPEFSPGGRMRVFHEGFWEYWVSGQNTGLIPASSLLPVTVCVSVLLPILLRYPNRFTLIKQIAFDIKLLAHFATASVFMFLAAHLLLFKLYLPNRYTQHSLRIILCVAGGITVAAILDAVFHSSDKQVYASIPGRKLLAVGLVALLAITLAVYPGKPREFMHASYRVGREPQLYEFFSRQPKDILIASLSREADRIPVFAKRSNLVSWECSLPFHKGYYSQMRRRAIDLINAQYGPDVGELQSFIRKYGVDFVLVDRRAFEPDYLASDKWIRLYQPAANDAMTRLKQGSEPALARLIKRCSEFETEDHIVLAAECILKASPE